MEQCLFSRSHGAQEPFSVSICPDGTYKVGNRPFRSKKKLLHFVTGTTNWSWDRYFNLGKYQKVSRDQPWFFDYFSSPKEETPTKQVYRFPKKVDNDPLELNRRYKEIAKLLYAGFGKRIIACGYDMEDVLQEVYKGLIIRQKGKCPYTPGKSSFGHYVHMVCGCIISNYHRKQVKTRQREQIGISGMTTVTDVAHAASNMLSHSVFMDENTSHTNFVKILEEKTKDPTVSLQVLQLLDQGFGRSEIAGMIGISDARASKVIKQIREVGTEWNGLVALHS